MRKLLLCTVAAVFVLGIGGTAAIAARNFVAKPLQTIEATPMVMGPIPNAACRVGNLNPPYWAIGNFLLQSDAYKLVFDPTTCTACPLGLRVTGVHILLQVSEPTTLFMIADVEEAIYPGQPWCAVPGPEWCVSPRYTVDLPFAGLWDVGLPIFCDCLPPIGKYLLSIHFAGYDSASGSVPDLITDAGYPFYCTNWNNFGLGWNDLVVNYYPWRGNLNIYADVECCSPPVPVEENSWGKVKALYKN
jgi:hypothetical protein